MKKLEKIRKEIEVLDTAMNNISIQMEPLNKAFLEFYDQKRTLQNEMDKILIKEKKNDVIKRQKYEEAAKLRDVEKQLNTQLQVAKERWEEETLKNRQLVSEDNVDEVVSMITGIPVQKVNQSENKKLSKMYENNKKESS